MLICSSNALNSRTVLRVMIIAICILSASLVGTNRGSIVYIIPITALFVCGVYVLIRWPNIGLIILFISALSLVFAFDTGSQTKIHLAIIIIPLMSAIWLVNMVRQRSVRLAPSEINKPALLFILCVVLSFLAGNMSWHYPMISSPMPAQLGGLAVFILSMLLMLIVANTQKNTRLLAFFVVLLLIYCLITSLGRISDVFGTLSVLLVREPGATGSMFWVWTVALAGGMCLYNTRLRMGIRVLLGIFTAMIMGVSVLYVSNWTSGWLPPLVVLITLFALKSKSMALVIFTICLLFLATRPELIGLVVKQETYSIITREAAWDIMLKNIIPLSPVLGLGPANYYQYTSMFSIMGYDVNFNSHNQYIDLLAQVGIVGTAVFLWLMASAVRVAWSIRNRASVGFNRAYAYCSIGAIAGMLWAGLHGDWVFPFVYNIGIDGFRASMLAWLFLGGLIAIEQITREHTPDKVA